MEKSVRTANDAITEGDIRDEFRYFLNNFEAICQAKQGKESTNLLVFMTNSYGAEKGLKRNSINAYAAHRYL